MHIDRFCPAERAPREGGVWDYLSPSRLNLWLKCPLAFRLKYIDRIPTPPTAARFIGRRVHAGLELYYRQRQLGQSMAWEEVLRRVDGSWEEAVDTEAVAFSHGDEEQTARRQTAALLQAYLVQVPDDEPRPLAVEGAAAGPLIDPESGEDLGMPLVGILDLVLRGGEGQQGPRIIDFKTSSRSAAEPEIAHEIQLGSYAWLFRRVTGQAEGGLEIRSLIRTRVPKIEYHGYAPRSDAHFRRLFAVVRAYLDDLEAGRFVFRPEWGCSSCEHRDGPCRRWQGTSSQHPPRTFRRMVQNDVQLR